jgi:Ca2+-binding RTX toxin-like protein
MATGVDGYDLDVLQASGVADVTFSADQKLIYAALRNGDVTVFDVATHEQVATWSVGNTLGAVSASEDGSCLLVVERAPNGDRSTLYKVSTADGSVETFKLPGGAFYDVEIVDERTAIITGGQEDVTKFDLVDNRFSTLPGGVYYGNYSVIVEDGRYSLLGEPGISNGPLKIYDDVLGRIVASGDDYQDGAESGFNWGSEAISEEAGLVLQFVNRHAVNVYDLDLKFQELVDFGEEVDGIVFDESGANVYAYSIYEGAVIKYSSRNFRELERFDVGFSQWHNNIGYGSQIQIDDSGKYITVTDASDVGKMQLIDLTVRDGTYKGTAGADSFAGGLGDDTYYVNNPGDVVTEKGGQGDDRVVASVDYTLTGNVEDLVLMGSAVSGAGNDLGNLIVGTKSANVLSGAGGADSIQASLGNDSLSGGDGADTLDGGGGADSLEGGLGDDTYVVDNLRDTVVEAEGAGHDFVRSAVRFSLTTGLEDLVLLGAADLDGHGNGLDNSIVGNAGANRLFGLAGADTLAGGSGNDRLDGGFGGDVMSGGAGDDTYLVDDVLDQVVEVRKGGADTVQSSVTFALGPDVENLVLTGKGAIDGIGNELANTITGNGKSNLIEGGRGADVLYGGLGRDIFVYASVGSSAVGAADRIADFEAGDRLDLSLIDADGHREGDGAFTRVSGDGAFTVAGQFRLTFDGHDTHVELNTDNDLDAEMDIVLAGNHTAVGAEGGWVL